MSDFNFAIIKDQLKFYKNCVGGAQISELNMDIYKLPR